MTIHYLIWSRTSTFAFNFELFPMKLALSIRLKCVLHSFVKLLFVIWPIQSVIHSHLQEINLIIAMITQGMKNIREIKLLRRRSVWWFKVLSLSCQSLVIIKTIFIPFPRSWRDCSSRKNAWLNILSNWQRSLSIHFHHVSTFNCSYSTWSFAACLTIRVSSNSN